MIKQMKMTLKAKVFCKYFMEIYLDTHKIHPVHRGTPSFDDIPLKKVHKPFGEILDIELK